MTDLIVVPKGAQWQRLKRLVLASVSSPITRRVYNLGLDEFFEWYGREPRPGFTKATVCAWRVALEARGLGIAGRSNQAILYFVTSQAKPPLEQRRTSGGNGGERYEPG